MLYARRVLLLAVALAVTLACGVCGGGHTSTGNLLLNPGADAAKGSSDGTKVATPDWTVTGQATALQYGAAGGYPTAKDPGPPDRGRNFFAGGADGSLATMSQTVDLSPYSGAIDSGGQRFLLSGWLGGWEDQGDHSVLTVEFLDGSAHPLGSPSQIGPVLASDRKNKTSLLQRELAGVIPAHARHALVTLTMTRVDGTANDGYADSLVFQLTA